LRAVARVQPVTPIVAAQVEGENREREKNHHVGRVKEIAARIVAWIRTG
jgi:hypothetical protein